MSKDTRAVSCKRAALFAPDRLRRIGGTWALAAMFVVGFHLWGETRVGLVDTIGHLFGDDTLNFWAPLALLSFLPFWAVWLGGGWLLFAVCVRYWLPGQWLLYAAAMPAVMVNAISGQVGCWIAAIFGFALILLPTQPLAAGLVFSLAIFKPQLVWLVPLAFFAGRFWRALAGFVVGAALLLVGSVWAFGLGLWADYARQVQVLRVAILENGDGVWHRFISMFVLVRHLGASVGVAYGVQGAVSLGMVGLVMWVWRTARASSTVGAPARRNAVLVLASIFASPYVSDYDLVVAAFVPLWLLSGREDTGAWVVAALVLVTPLVAAPLVLGTGIAAAGLLLVPALYYTVRIPSV